MNESGDSNMVVIKDVCAAEHEGEAEPRAHWDLRQDGEDEGC